jgi:hypothetical protein
MVVLTDVSPHPILGAYRVHRSSQGAHMDEELRQLDLAIARARRLATETLEALRAPQASLRSAATDYIASVAARRVDASRRASVEAMAKLDDDEVAELRLWVEEQIAAARAGVESDIESCDFWIPDAPGMSPNDVTSYGNALMPRPRDSRMGVPQALVQLFERGLTPLRRGLVAVGLASVPAEAEPRVEVALVRAWRTYREAAIECIARWADVDERYHASAERFQEMRWELAGEVDPATIKARQAADEAADRETSLAASAAKAAAADVDESLPDLDRPETARAIVRSDSETLVPLSG